MKISSKLIEIIQNYTKSKDYVGNKKDFYKIIDTVVPNFYATKYPEMLKRSGKRDTVQYRLEAFEQYLGQLGYKQRPNNFSSSVSFFLGLIFSSYSTSFVCKLS